MKTAVMQPYFLPYIGYFQLLSTVSSFVVFDDANFIKKGWINRNRVLLNEKPHYITLPLSGASQNRLINEIELVLDPKNIQKKLDMIYHAYGKAPYFEQIFQMIEDIFCYKETNLSIFVIYSLKKIAEYLAIDTQFLISSKFKKDNHLKGQEKILEICRKVGATHYINPIGGMELYRTEAFRKNGIRLSFLKTDSIEYRQFRKDFVPNLSIIDTLMFISKNECKKLLNKYSFLTN